MEHGCANGIVTWREIAVRRASCREQLESRHVHCAHDVRDRGAPAVEREVAQQRPYGRVAERDEHKARLAGGHGRTERGLERPIEGRQGGAWLSRRQRQDKASTDPVLVSQRR